MSNNIDSIIDSDDIILNFSKISNTSLKNNTNKNTILSNIKNFSFYSNTKNFNQNNYNYDDCDNCKFFFLMIIFILVITLIINNRI